ncbi:hypothetical protein ACX1C1_05320 [Paenibacillus sp. strain BS8-2]
MKAYVYVRRKRDEWEAWMTLAPDVDYAYWLDHRYAKEEAECIWIWSEELPLGQAAEAVERWRARSTRIKALADVGRRLGISSKGGWTVRGATPYETLSEAEAVRLMSRCIEESKELEPRSRFRAMLGWARNAIGYREVEDSRESRFRTMQKERSEGSDTKVEIDLVESGVTEWEGNVVKGKAGSGKMRSDGRGVEERVMNNAKSMNEQKMAGQQGSDAKSINEQKMAGQRGSDAISMNEQKLARQLGSDANSMNEQKMAGQRSSDANTIDVKAWAAHTGRVKDVQEKQEHRWQESEDAQHDWQHGLKASAELQVRGLWDIGGQQPHERTKPAVRRQGVVRWSAGDGRRAMDADRWSHAAAIAKLAATLMQGRALLSAEARALLASATVPGAEEANWREAFQLAALHGQVRLGGAVAAPVGKRADARRRLRCQRCGSGEAQLRRAACLACGRDCAYCEACILMGRSRECELLIRGVYDSPVWKEHGLGRWKVMRKQSTPERLGRWSLSPAQRDATAKALDYLEERPTMRRQQEKSQRFRNSIHSALARFVSPAGYRERSKEKHASESAQRDIGVSMSSRDSQSMVTSHRVGQVVEHTGAKQSVASIEGNKMKTRSLSDSYEAKGGQQLVQSPMSDRKFLIWAVTGAGKTEMVL